MELLRDWLLGVTAAAFAAAAAIALTPEGAVKKVVRLSGGLVLILAVLRPLPGLPLSLPDPGGELTAASGAAAGGENVLKELIAQKAGAYIADKGSALGCLCTAEVTVAEDGSGWPVPWSVQIKGSWTGEQKAALRKAAEDLGIPEERQSFQEEGI